MLAKTFIFSLMNKTFGLKVWSVLEDFVIFYTTVVYNCSKAIAISESPLFMYCPY